MFELEVLENREIADGQHLLVLALGDTPLRGDYAVPGQYVQLSVGEAKPAFMAIGSPPGLDRFEFLIGRSAGTAGLICDVDAGGRVRCSAVMGKGFAVSRLAGRTAVFMAGGTGISAVRALIESRPTWPGGSRLVYGARAPSALAWTELFEAWADRGVQVHATVDEAAEGWDGHVGYPQQVYALDPLPDASNAALVLCGPGPMCDAATAMLVEAGMPADLALKNY
jgi:NAD(P)H-flavin reductase